MNEQRESRQHQLMALLLDSKSGLSVDEIADHLQISRTAVNQHLATLEKQHLIQESDLNTNTGGRPARKYVLTTLGVNRFPKQYSWFCNLLLSELAEEMTAEAMEALMRKMGVKLAKSLSLKFADKDSAQRLQLLVEIMQDLGYRADLEYQDNQPYIKATNCVYHDLAQQHPALCLFDKALISSLLSSPILQTACMVKNDCACAFRVMTKN